MQSISFGKKILLILLVVGIGFGAYWYFYIRSPEVEIVEVSPAPKADNAKEYLEMFSRESVTREEQLAKAEFLKQFQKAVETKTNPDAEAKKFVESINQSSKQ
jgi:hypothetical protein